MSEEQEKRPRLTGLQRAFIDAWFGPARFNGTEAARLAGYSGGDNPERERAVWQVAASQVLSSNIVREEIDRRWVAQNGVSEGEVVATLARQMRMTPTDFMDDYGNIDLEAVRIHGRGVVKGLEVDEKGKIKLTLESPQKAAELIGRTMALFRDVQEQKQELHIIMPPKRDGSELE